MGKVDDVMPIYKLKIMLRIHRSIISFPGFFFRFCIDLNEKRNEEIVLAVVTNNLFVRV